MISFATPMLKWVFICGIAVGIAIGAELGQWLAWLTLRNPLAWLFREYRELYAESDRLADAFIEGAPWVTAGATPSQGADLCAVSVATEEAARHL